MIKVDELKGLKSLRAFNAFNMLLMGLKMLPAYMAVSYEDFFKSLDAMTPEDQKKMLVKAAMFVKLEPEELEAMISFCRDKNGVPYSSANIKNLDPAELIDIVVAVSLELAKLGSKLDFVSESEKKK